MIALENETGKIREAIDSNEHCFPTNVDPLSGIPHDHVNRYKELKRIIQKHGSENRILDLGCGSGYGALILKGVYNRYWGIDISEGAIEFANKYIKPEIDIIEKRFIQGKLPNILLGITNKFDIISFVESIDHIDYKGQGNILKHIKRLLVDNGLVFISCLRRQEKRGVDRSYGEEFGYEFSASELIKYGKRIGDIVYLSEQSFISPADCWRIKPVEEFTSEYNEDLDHPLFQQITVRIK